jgi:hypothetical protein
MSLLIANPYCSQSSYFFWFEGEPEDMREYLIYWIDWSGNLILDHASNYMIFWDQMFSEID